jgi:hypothetical protein
MRLDGIGQELLETPIRCDFGVMHGASEECVVIYHEGLGGGSGDAAAAPTVTVRMQLCIELVLHTAVLLQAGRQAPSLHLLQAGAAAAAAAAKAAYCASKELLASVQMAEAAAEAVRAAWGSDTSREACEEACAAALGDAQMAAAEVLERGVRAAVHAASVSAELAQLASGAYAAATRAAAAVLSPGPTANAAGGGQPPASAGAGSPPLWPGAQEAVTACVDRAERFARRASEAEATARSAEWAGENPCMDKLRSHGVHLLPLRTIAGNPKRLLELAEQPEVVEACIAFLTPYLSRPLWLTKALLHAGRQLLASSVEKGDPDGGVAVSCYGRNNEASFLPNSLAVAAQEQCTSLATAEGDMLTAILATDEGHGLSAAKPWVYISMVGVGWCCTTCDRHGHHACGLHATAWA